MVGDSAGAQLVSQYAAMLSNPSYMELFVLEHPGEQIRLRAVGLNCGMYDAKQQASGPRKGISLDYLGRKLSADDPRLDVLRSITRNFPPAKSTAPEVKMILPWGMCSTLISLPRKPLAATTTNVLFHKFI